MTYDLTMGTERATVLQVRPPAVTLLLSLMPFLDRDSGRTHEAGLQSRCWYVRRHFQFAFLSYLLFTDPVMAEYITIMIINNIVDIGYSPLLRPTQSTY